MLGKENISYGQNIFVYMKIIMDKKKAEKLDSISIARCFCFKCRIKSAVSTVSWQLHTTKNRYPAKIKKIEYGIDFRKWNDEKHFDFFFINWIVKLYNLIAFFFSYQNIMNASWNEICSCVFLFPTKRSKCCW